MKKTKSGFSHSPLFRIIAHRGASGHAPENTLAALSLAADHSAQSVEIDVSISLDGVAYVHHDDKLNRCTNGQGLLCKHTSDQLDKLDASTGHPDYQGEPLPRLTAVLELLISRGLGLNLEIKPYAGLEEPTVDAIKQCINALWPTDLPLVLSSFNQVALEQALDKMPDVPRALLLGNVTDDWASLMDRYQCQNLHCAANSLDNAQAANVTAQGFGLYCYTVNDVDLASRLFSMGVHGVFTDFPKRFLQQFDA